LPAETTFILVTAIVAALVGFAALVAVWLERGVPAVDAERAGRDRVLGGGPATPGDALSDAAEGGYAAAIRILWWISIASVLVGVGLTDAFRSTQPAIYGVGAGAVVVAVVLHDLLPSSRRTASVVAVEVLLALALVTGLLALTGYGASPFSYAYSLVAVAVALALGPRIALGVAALATISYLGVLLLDPALNEVTEMDLLRVGLSIGSIWLLAFLAGAFASGERRKRARLRIDPLTGLMNRWELLPTLEQEVQRTRRSERGFCLLMVDLDGLKAVNDSHGHDRGDDVLRALGAVISQSIRTVDAGFRLGGDEFLVILPETEFAGAFVVAEKIRAGAEEVGLRTRGDELMTSVSIGLVSCPEDGMGAQELMLAADRAMYQAKSLGKNQISGNPRPIRLGTRALPAPDSPPPPVEAAVPAPSTPTSAPPSTEPHPMAQAARQPSRAAVAATLTAPVPAARAMAREAANGAHEGAEDEPDPSDVRRHIAAARLHMDPDHQIRRAMDAFLSPQGPPER
jgi:diguanylate cyclase (GGDEF)-like protein